MGFKSFLSAIGADFKKGIAWIAGHGPGIIHAAQNIEAIGMPVLSLLLPALAPEAKALIDTILNAAVSVEQKFAAQGLQSGTGAQKAAEVLSIVGPVAQSTLSKLGVPADTAAVSKWIDVGVGFLNSLPADLAALQAPEPPAPNPANTQG